MPCAHCTKVLHRFHMLILLLISLRLSPRPETQKGIEAIPLNPSLSLLRRWACSSELASHSEDTQQDDPPPLRQGAWLWLAPLRSCHARPLTSVRGQDPSLASIIEADFRDPLPRGGITTHLGPCEAARPIVDDHISLVPVCTLWRCNCDRLPRS